MSPSNSTSKVAKAARASSSRRGRPGQGRNLGFPVAVGLIVLLGILVTFAGRDRRVSAADEPPRLGVDHWHAAWGLYLCDNWGPMLYDQQGDARGVHTHDDNVIHIHPFSSVAAGERSNLGDFFNEVKLEVDDDEIVLPGGETYRNGDDCGGQPGRVVLAVWDDANSDEQRLVTDDVAGTRFVDDRMAFTLAFVPEGAEVPKPESVPTLDNLSDVDPSQQTGATSTTVAGDGTNTTAPGETTSTAPGDTTTSAPGDTTSTTAATTTSSSPG